MAPGRHTSVQGLPYQSPAQEDTLPIHRIPRATMHEDLHSIEREGEQVVSVAADGPDHVLVGTVTQGQRLEERTHAHRIGAQ